MISGTFLDKMGERCAHFLQLFDLAVDSLKMLLGDLLYLGAGTLFVFVERKKIAAIFNCETERTGASQKRELVRVTFTERAITVAGRPERVATSPIFMS